MHRIATVTAAFVAMMVLLALPVWAQDVIKIAAGAPLTGPLAKQGQEVANAVKLAADEWNAKGGVLGKKIVVMEADDQGNPQIGVAAAEKVAADPAVMGSVWGITSVTCIPASEVLDRSNIVLISPGCTNPKVTDRGLKSVNRVCARDDFQAPAGAVWLIEELKKKKIAVFDDGTTGPRGGADEFEKKAKALGATVIRYVIRAGDKDFRPILGTIPKDVDAIYASIWAPDAALLVKQLPDVGLSVPMMGPDGQFEPVDYIQASGGAAEGNYVSFLVPDMSKVPSAQAFAKAFQAKYGTASSYGPLAYEAANILLTAIKTVGKPDRAAIRDAVRATKNYQGMLGNSVTFNDKGDIDTQTIYIYQVKGPDFVQVKTLNLGS
ncbi:MAG TPA: branched-chain amino acid ABC transporter substrate-binding protein [Acetobacteraceae bacterium]|nr:branched-chain amino acid ABC transporter substrate-binding protein [Acetobacteraceae bacterium]